MRRDNYIVIRNFIEEDKVHQMCEDYKKFCVDNNLKGDWLVEKCYSYHNYLPYLELLMHKSGYFSELIGEPVLPTFTYSRMYLKGSKLPIHRDQANCELNTSVNIGCDKLWDFMIHTPYPINESRRITLNPGDAIFYEGMGALHWREEFEGEYYCGAFLCYVRSRGEHVSCAYDHLYTHGPGVVDTHYVRTHGPGIRPKQSFHAGYTGEEND